MALMDMGILICLLFFSVFLLLFLRGGFFFSFVHSLNVHLMTE